MLCGKCKKREAIEESFLCEECQIEFDKICKIHNKYRSV